MKAPSVNLKRYMKVEGKWKFVPIARLGNKYVPDRVVVNGKSVKPTTGQYYVEWWEAGSRKQRPVGDNWRSAMEAVRIQTHVLALRAEGSDIEDAPQIQSRGETLKAAVDKYLENAALTKKSFLKYRNALLEFLDYTSVLHIESVTRDEMIAFMRFLEREKKLNPKTVTDKAVIVLAFVRRHDAKVKMESSDWPPVVEKMPRLYQPEPMRKLFEAADREEFELFQTFRMTGFRDQELGFTAWDDFDAKAMTLSVTAKPELGFKPKNYQERTISITPAIVNLLVERQKRNHGDYLMFPTSEHNRGKGLKGGMRDRHMLDKVKRLAKRAGLNCGRCKSTYIGKPATCATAPICRQWGLHRFRHTYATTLLRDGVDIHTLQRLMGHKDLNSTMKYLHAAQQEEAQAKISNTRLASLEIR